MQSPNHSSPSSPDHRTSDFHPRSNTPAANTPPPHHPPARRRDGGWEMRRIGTRRWLAPWKDSPDTPVLYHVISRVVDRRLIFQRDEKEHFRKLMRMHEAFSGCRVLAYCIMGNHFHMLLEVPPGPEAGLSAGSLDPELFAGRLSGIYEPARVAEILKQLNDALNATDGSEASRIRVTEEIAGPYLARMHDLSEFMNGVLKRFTRWFNRRNARTGTLWEERFKSVIVENGVPARTVAAYIDLNPVRAGMVRDPADYRWSGYGEAVGAGGRSVAGRSARGGLVRALLCSSGVRDDPARWSEVSARYRFLLRQAIERKGKPVNVRQGNVTGATPGPSATDTEHTDFSTEMGFAGMLMKRMRYFTAGVIIGSRECVESCFIQSRHRFGPRRKTGPRKLKGKAAPAAGVLWSMRDLRDDASPAE